MGFIDYARSHSFEKDVLKLKIIIDPILKYPDLEQRPEGYVITIPTPSLKKETINYLGYTFPVDNYSKLEVARLFKAAVYHLTAHSVTSNFQDYKKWKTSKNKYLAQFIPSLVEDFRVNAYITTWYPEKVKELANASALSLLRMRDIENIALKSTRLMTSLLIYANTGLEVFSKRDQDILHTLYKMLKTFKSTLKDSEKDEESEVKDEKIAIADRLYEILIEKGPIIEAPSLPYTENLGETSLFPKLRFTETPILDNLVESIIGVFGGLPADGDKESLRKVDESEALQVFESHIFEKEKEKKIRSKYEGSLLNSRFKALEFPRQDFTEFVRAKNRCKKETNKLTERLLSASNATLEDIRKLYGVLDLSDAIKVIASKSDRTDVFLRDEKMVKSYAWAIIVDASRSMKHIRDYTIESAIILTEAASKVLLDQYSWWIYGFNEKLYVIKDFIEPYNTRARSRLGGLDFKGVTYLPDAVEVVGNALRKRAEDLKLLFLISDGQPFGYSNIFMAASEVISQIQSGDLVVVGIGAQSNSVEYIFDDHIAAFDLKDYVDQLSRLYMAKSEDG